MNLKIAIKTIVKVVYKSCFLDAIFATQPSVCQGTCPTVFTGPPRNH